MSIILLNSTPQNLSRWEIFTAAPHRLWFFFGTVGLMSSMSWWLLHLLGRDLGNSTLIQTATAPTWAHGFLMLYGAFSFFIFGFLMTVYPRWLNTSAIPKSLYLPAALLSFIGYLLSFTGLMFSHMLAIAGSLVMLAGWAISLIAFILVLKRTDKITPHALATTLGLSAGWCGVFLFFLWLSIGNAVFAQLGIGIGLWCYLLPIFFAVCHRMIPFFSQTAIFGYKLYRPMWSLSIFVGACYLHFALETIGLQKWMLVCDIPLFLIALQHSIKWQPQHCLKTPILASLHIGFAWLWIAMGMLIYQDIMLLNNTMVLPLAPLHALTIGFFTSMLIAMATRVTMGHSGNPLNMDRITWIIFLAVQIIALTRVAASIPAINSFFTLSFNTIGAMLWLACMLPWVIKYAPIYLKRRADNQPG